MVAPAWLPGPPDWRLDWPAVVTACPWLAPLAATPQDPAFHAEGDVLTHTGMVLDALAGLAEWRALPENDRAAVMVAALLHDVGKPDCTRAEGGAITSRGHARAGAAIARRLLWGSEGLGPPPEPTVRAEIAALVRLHGLPIWFLDRADMERAVLGASVRARLDLVALLAEADARGRICAGQAELIARVGLFRDWCAERGCLDRPFAFASDHSRVRYLRGRQADPHYRAHDDTWGEVTLLAGLPGAGKDTWLRANQPDTPRVALDEIRAELRIDPAGGQGAVVAAARERARELLRRRQPFAWNATNLTRQIRDPLIDMLLDYGARVRIVYLDAPPELALRRNRQRPAPVPEAVILRLAQKAEPPDLTEAHRVEIVDASASR